MADVNPAELPPESTRGKKKVYKSKWRDWDSVPVGVLKIMRVYNGLFGLHHTNHVVRLMDGHDQRVFIQVYGRVGAGKIAKLAKLTGCYIEVEARAPGYILIRMYGGLPIPKEPEICYRQGGMFLYRPI